MDIQEFGGNCGIVELMGLQGKAKSVLQEFARNFFEEVDGDYDDNYTYTTRFGLVVFSDRVPKTGKSAGMKLAEYIKENGLGEITQSHSVKNPNSMNTITLWTWTPNAKYKELFAGK